MIQIQFLGEVDDSILFILNNIKTQKSNYIPQWC